MFRAGQMIEEKALHTTHRLLAVFERLGLSVRVALDRRGQSPLSPPALASFSSPHLFLSDLIYSPY